MFRLSEIAQAVDGKLDPRFAGVKARRVVMDSRGVKPGDVFVAIKGQRFDGHRFVAGAFQKKAVAAVVSRSVSHPRRAMIRVGDTTLALGQLGAWMRGRFDIPLVAVTGSAGKTSVKEMIAAVLGRRYVVLKNHATFNNHIGVPMTLLDLRPRHQLCVLELGTNHFGEIAYLARICRPDVSVLMNIGASHLEFLNNERGVFREKYNCVRYMKPRGVVIYNRDDRFLRRIPSYQKKRHCISFGITPGALFRATDINVGRNGVSFRVGRRAFHIASPGVHYVYNGLAAVACGRHFGVPYHAIKTALAGYEPPAGRLTIGKKRGVVVVNDSYNANPLSFRYAIDTLCSLPVSGRRIAVCGDMLELGRRSLFYHRQVGQWLAEKGVDAIFSLGDKSREISAAFGRRKRANRARHFRTIPPLLKAIKDEVKSGDAVLVKGSRRLGMERVADRIFQ